MEVTLLIIIIILMIIAQFTRNSKADFLENKLSKIEKYLEAIHKAGILNGNKEKSKETVSEKAHTSVVPPPEAKVVVPPIIVPETIVPPVAAPVIVPEVIIPPIVPITEVPIQEEKKAVVHDKIVQPIKIATEKPKEKNQDEKVEEIKKPENVIAEEKPSFIKTEAPKPFVPKEPEVPKENWYDTFRKNNPDLEKFIGENILSKVAITILVIGIAFFVKYAIDKDWINETARVGIGILCGGIVLGFAHRLHKKFAAFSSVLVAGGIAIFYFTIGFAFHQYHLFSQTTAFVIMFVITGFSVFISLAYNRIELAALSLIGGFATPFMVSTGAGNYKVLFVYVLILDVGMLVLAYMRKWNLINIMTYCFTMALYVSWLETKVIGVSNAPYMGALIFGTAFYVIFILMNIVNNVKEQRKFAALELSILISNTFLYFGEGLHILDNFHPEAKGLFSISLAVFNLICSWLLFKKFKADKNLVYMMIGLTLTFITVSAPIQLEGNYITLVWAFESVMLIWLAQRSKIQLYRLTSIVVTILMFISLLMDWDQAYTAFVDVPTMNIIFNKGCLTGILSALSLAAIAFLLKKEIAEGINEKQPKFLDIEYDPKKYAVFLNVTSILLFYFSGMFELVYQLHKRTNEGEAFFIIVYAYHLIFLSIVNLRLPYLKHRYLETIIHTFNTASVALFVLWIAALPVSDFKDNIVNAYSNYTGFLFHYLCLAAAIFISLRMSHYVRNKVVMRPIHPAFYPTIISVVIVYVSSIELVLHVLQFGIHNVTDPTPQLVNLKLGEVDLLKVDVYKIGFPILWGLLSFAFLSIGMRKHNKTLRISGLLLIAVILIKLFTYDIKDASEAGKIIAFIILGVVLLIISFMYQKIKALLIDDSKKKETIEDNINKDKL